MAGDCWLAFETSKDHAFNSTLFIGMYAGIGVISCVLVIIRSYVVTHWGLKTAQSFFTGMLQSILHAPMSFFDTTPSGRILSRKYYLASSRELSRLDSIAKAPVIHQFSETISGVTTIRGFRKQITFCEENINRVNANLRVEFHNNGSYEWLAFRLDLLGAVFLCMATMLMIFLPSAIMKPEYVGLSLSYGPSLSAVVAISVTLTCQVENKMVSVENKAVLQYSIRSSMENP